MNFIKSPINGYFSPDDPGEPGSGFQRLSVNDVEAKFIAEFAYDRIVLEIGTGLGVATRAMAKVAKEVHTVDIDPWVLKTIVPDLPDNVFFYEKLTATKPHAPFDMALIDGLHSFEQVKKDIPAVMKLVKPGCPILFHDYKMQTVARAIAFCSLDTIFVNTLAGIGVAWNEK